MTERTSHLAGLWIGAAISNTSQTKPVLPLSNEHDSQVKYRSRRQCCHNKHKNFPIALHVMYLYFPDTPRRSHTATHHSRLGFSERVISSSQRPLPDSIHYLQQTDIHATDRIRTRNLSRRAAADLCLRPRGHWYRHRTLVLSTNIAVECRLDLAL